MALKKKCVVYVLWNTFENLFCDKKENKALQLETQIRNITMDDSSVTNYRTRIKHIADLLQNIDAPVLERNLIVYTLSGLSPKLQYVTTTIKYQKPKPSFMEVWSMLLWKKKKKRCFVNNKTKVPFLILVILLPYKFFLPRQIINIPITEEVSLMWQGWSE